MVELIDEAYPDPANDRPGSIIEGRAILTRDEDFTARGRFEQTGDMEESRFTGTRRSDKGDDLAWMDSETGVEKNVEPALALGIASRHVTELENRLHSYRRASTGSRRAARHDG